MPPLSDSDEARLQPLRRSRRALGNGELAIAKYSPMQRRPERFDQRSKSAGSFPPFSDIFCNTCLCSQMFIAAESFGSPV